MGAPVGGVCASATSNSPRLTWARRICSTRTTTCSGRPWPPGGIRKIRVPREVPVPTTRNAAAPRPVPTCSTMRRWKSAARTARSERIARQARHSRHAKPAPFLYIILYINGRHAPDPNSNMPFWNHMPKSNNCRKSNNCSKSNKFSFRGRLSFHSHSVWN